VARGLGGLVAKHAAKISDSASAGSFTKTMSAQSVHTQTRICASGQKRTFPRRSRLSRPRRMAWTRDIQLSTNRPAAADVDSAVTAASRDSVAALIRYSDEFL